MRWGLGLLAAVAAWGLVATSAARGDDKPILMLDTGGHQALIWGITLTADGKYVVSAGDDKVVRVWDWRAGKTVRTIRGQVGPGHEGKIFAMALSPDGRWLAVGGFMAPGYGVRDEDVGDIRLYDFASGELKALLKGHTNATIALAFSPDSKRLISGATDRTAIIWEVASRKSVHRLQGHTDHIFGVGFTPDGARAVTTSLDKTLRLWNVADGSLVRDMPGHSDGVRALAVSPKNDSIASGDDSGEIRLWDGKTGAFVRTLARQGGCANSLRFSPDGRLLLSTCGTQGDCGYKQRIFDVASGQELTVYSKHNNIVMASAFSPDGRFVTTGGGDNQEIHIWDPRTGETKAVLKGTGSTSWAAGFSADSRQIAWGHTFKQESPVDRGPLEMAMRLPGVGETLGEPEAVASQEGWVRAHTRFGAWSLQHRKGGAYGYDAILDILQDGKVQASIERGATNGYSHRAYGITPDGETVISGGNGGILTAYRLDGSKIGDFIGHESDVWAVAASPDGKYLVSGANDQTVRLWNLQTRELLVSLFYGSDGEWVMWTPEGFFTSSQHGAERVGWQVNQGPDKEARYVAGDQLRKAFFRPDLVVEKIAGDPSGKVREAAAELKIEEVLAGGIAPDVVVISPVEGARADDVSVAVTVRVTDKGGGIGRIAWRINGQVIGSSYGAAALNAKGEITRSFDLDAAENTIEVVAANKSGLVESKPARVSVKVDARALKGVPDLYILAVGVDDYNDYNNVKYKLRFAFSDAKDLSDAIADAGSSFYRHKPQVVVLRDGEATAERLSATFKALGAKIKANDVFLFFIAGHGKTIKGDYYFVPRSIDAFTNDAIAKQGFGPPQWQEWFANIQARKSIWIFDTCESGAAANVFFTMRGNTADDAAYKRLKDATGRVIFMAASDLQTAAEGFHDHGLLTYTILEGLALAGDGKDDKIDVIDLAKYVKLKVPQYSREMKACRIDRQQDSCQRPQVPDLSDDYPLVPRYPQILARINPNGPAISRLPTHMVVVTADLLEQAAPGSPVTRQLRAGTLVTVIEPIEGGWAHVAQEGKAIGYVQEERLLKILQ
jgi:WD40 repeat protein